MINPGRIRNSEIKGVIRTRHTPKKIWNPSHSLFQRKYTTYILVSVFGGVAFFLGVAFYKLFQNYELFKSLAFDIQPDLVQHLEREVIWFGFFCIATGASIFIFCLLIGLRLTSALIRPFLHMERHMRKVLHGDLRSADFRYSDQEDLVEILDTYSLMYRTIRSQIQTDIELINQISVDPDDRESVEIINKFIRLKQKQLSNTESSNPKIVTTDEIAVRTAA
jgi:hypothetical protein